MPILLSDSEINALHEQDAYYFKLYVHVLRRYMDYSTGIVGGPKRRISYQSIREEMYVSPRRGVSRKETGLQTKSGIRRALKHLARIGLIEQSNNDGKDDHLIFKCLLATVGKFQSKSSRHILSSQVVPEAETLRSHTNSTNINASQLNAHPIILEDDIPANNKPTHLCISDENLKEKELLRSSRKKSKRNKPAELPADFCVINDHRQMAEKKGWPDPSGEIEKFREYHLEKGTLMLDWDRAFYKWLENSKRYNLKEKLNGIYQQKGYTKQNSVSTVVDNILRARLK